MNAKLKRRATNAAVFAASMTVALLACELVLRHRYADRVFYKPRPEVWRIQEQLIADPHIGFTWKPNVTPDDNIRLDYADVKPALHSTDEWGFLNPPQAIDERRRAGRVDVCGLGDSFMELCAWPFFSAFQERGLTYYSLAIHRQAPPQYNAVLERYALPLEPKWILYGVFENDFQETTDFDDWKTSGLDWFTYHSGYWCGPPLGNSAPERVSKRWFKGYYSVYYFLRSRQRGGQPSTSGPSDREFARVQECIREAANAASSRNARFLLLLIPGRQTAMGAEPGESRAYDRLAGWSKDSGLATLDLRQAFRDHENPASLYYEIDGHWNARGIEVAAQLILDAIGAPGHGDSGKTGVH